MIKNMSVSPPPPPPAHQAFCPPYIKQTPWRRPWQYQYEITMQDKAFINVGFGKQSLARL